jgi:hypothetical protein
MMMKSSFATLGTLALIASAAAFGQQRRTADIPFEFHAGTVVMPAETYNVYRSFSNGTLYLECNGCKARAYVMTLPCGGWANESSADRLVFHKYGDTYFLSEVWSSNGAVGRALPKSKTEGEIALKASLPPTTRVVVARR